MTLSHCWGKSIHFSLRTTNVSQLYEAIPWDSLSRTFREAITFTHRLGITFLWIDALCIIQDSDADWLDQALSMVSIYSNSFLNLAATSSEDGNGGLLIAESPHLANGCMIQATWQGLPSGDYVVFDDTAWRRRIEEGVLNRRAWVLQERLLASRTVHFAYDQISWECTCLRASESYPTGIPDERIDIKPSATTAFQDMKRHPEDSAQINDCWLVIVQRYSECTLTKESDKLIALAGIAETTQNLLRCSPLDYLAGLWKMFLVKDLLWHLLSAGERYESYQAPSWSWVSVKGPVSFNPSGARVLDNEDLTIEVRGAVVERTETSRSFGRVSSGYIEVAAPLYRVVLGSVDLNSEWGIPSLQSLAINERKFVANKTLTESLDHLPIYRGLEDWVRNHTTYFCRFATAPQAALDTKYTSEGLLLERSVDMEKGHFRRFGWMRLFHDDTEEEFHLSCAGSERLADEDYLNRLPDGRYIIQIV